MKSPLYGANIDCLGTFRASGTIEGASLAFSEALETGWLGILIMCEKVFATIARPDETDIL